MGGRQGSNQYPIPDRMKAWVLGDPEQLSLTEKPVPQPGPAELSALPIGGLALLVDIDRFMAEIRAATNLPSNIIATLVIARWAGTVDMAKAARALSGGDDEPAPALAAAGD